MVRLIDAEELSRFFFSETSGTLETIKDTMFKHNLDYLHNVDEDAVEEFAIDLLRQVVNVIDTEPTVDAVPVVRCGECRYWGKDTNTICRPCEHPNTLYRDDVALDGGWYCPWGKRK